MDGNPGERQHGGVQVAKVVIQDHLEIIVRLREDAEVDGVKP